MKAGRLRHIADIYRTSKALDGRGQSRAEDLIAKSVPCSLRDLSGRESEQARSLYADAVLEVSMYGNPQKPLSVADVLVVGTRRLHVGHIKDTHQNGVELTLLCGEARK